MERRRYSKGGDVQRGGGGDVQRIFKEGGEEEKAKVRMGNNLYLQDIQFFNGGK